MTITRPREITSLKLATSPDSWGIWFDNDPHQVPWNAFLDQVKTAGFNTIELGPYGYLPTDPEQLREELGSRGMSITGGSAFTHLHRGGDSLKEAMDECTKVAKLITELGAEHMVILPEQYTDMRSGEQSEPGELSAEQWQNLVDGQDQLGKFLLEEHGVKLVFHPHADTHVDTQKRVDRFLQDTNPDFVNLCLDTGHLEYAGASSLRVIQEHPERVSYVHLKQVDPAVVERARAEKLSFADAVKLGAMIEPPLGKPDMEPILYALEKLDAEIITVIEHDLYPCAQDVPLPIAVRTRKFFSTCGLHPAKAR